MSREQFEQRMRARRAATCLAVARSAIASGRMAEAIDRLEEACALDPNAAEAQLLLEELRGQEPAEPLLAAEAPPRSGLAGWSHWVAAGVAICTLAAIAFFWPPRPSGTEGLAEPAYEAPVSSPADDSLPAATGGTPSPGMATQELQPVPGTGSSAVATSGAGDAAAGGRAIREGSVAIKVTDEPVVQQAVPIAAAAPDAPGDPAAAGERRIDTAPVAPLDVPAPAPAAGDTTPSPQAQASRPPTGVAVPPPHLPPLDRVPVFDEAPVKAALPELETTAGAAPAAVPAARAGAAETAAVRSMSTTDASEIEATLRRYTDAYARLDAAAARAVWPTVDQRALARAFEGLQSQGIMFEHCDVAVAGDHATANCNGRARYVPKVGSREPLVERRQWTFHLRKLDAGWQITQAEAR